MNRVARLLDFIARQAAPRSLSPGGREREQEQMARITLWPPEQRRVRKTSKPREPRKEQP